MSSHSSRRYKLEEHLPEFLSEKRTEDTVARIISDYRETMANYWRILPGNEWAHSHGS